ncbi:MAG: SDR family NAD(P)-dependent oxidoreductase [Bacteroidetes bacterium]|nr:SDR family NAD(P)-dependent oxidoreductase [Bacteroidota bacterium]MDA0942963.1 SDR family NAD(P)-dependent oxidoreductase [Bacteroidota bacterium]MDA1111665.1 SDR family NAD(P)-dependent oxidoreductase [Bacteroidota bacterium]
MVALITGASRGLGLAIAEALAQEGLDLILWSRNETLLKENSTRLAQSYGISVNVTALDLSNQEQIDQACQSLLDQGSTVDLLVNNAGNFLPGAMMEESESQLDDLWSVNVKAAYTITKRLWPALVQSPRAHVVNICSTASRMGYPAGGSYAVTKHALLGFSESLRLEGRPLGIRVSSVLPGAALTDSWAGVDLPEERFMKASDVGAVVRQIWQLNQSAVIEDITLRPLLGDI